MDLIVHSPLVAGPMHVDFTVVSALSRESLAKGSASVDGIASALASAVKMRKYPGCEVFPFAVEDHGRFGDSAATVIKMLAPQEPSERNRAISVLYQDMACTLQRAAAESVIAATMG